MSPLNGRRPKGWVSAIETWKLQLNALAWDHDESLSPRLKIAAAAAAAMHRTWCPEHGHCQGQKGSVCASSFCATGALVEAKLQRQLCGSTASALSAV